MTRTIDREKETLHAFHHSVLDDTKNPSPNAGRPLLASQVWLPLDKDSELRYAVFNIIYYFKKK